MLAVEISRHGGPDVLVPVDRADPVPARGEVLVRNRWAGINYVDLQHREGRPYPVTLPLVPGTEAAGTIVAVGPGVDADLVGTPVVHFRHLARGYAEFTPTPPAGAPSGRAGACRPAPGPLWWSARQGAPARPSAPARLSATPGDTGPGGPLPWRWAPPSPSLSGPHERARALPAVLDEVRS